MLLAHLQLGSPPVTVHTSRLKRTALLVCAIAAHANAMSQTLSWRPDFQFAGTFFPSYALSASGRDRSGPTENVQAYGYIGSSSLAVLVKDAPIGTKIRVEIEIPEIGVSGKIETLAFQTQKYIVPRLTWSQSRLASITQPLTAEAVFRVFVDGTLDREDRQTIRVRAITDAPLSACRSDKSCQDFSPYMAAFVNENSPIIDGVLRAALDIPAMPVKAWTGTQQGADEALRQVWALWYLFQRNKVTYSSIATVSEERPDITSQAIRPISQTLRTSQANCIDGTVLFASILRKIGIEPAIVLIPGHAFLAFYTDQNRQSPVFLETTMINAQGINPFYSQGPSKIGEGMTRALGSDIHMKQSWTGFMAAVSEGGRKYSLAKPKFGKERGYLFIPIYKAREAGILPLPL